MKPPCSATKCHTVRARRATNCHTVRARRATNRHSVRARRATNCHSVRARRANNCHTVRARRATNCHTVRARAALPTVTLSAPDALPCLTLSAPVLRLPLSHCPGPTRYQLSHCPGLTTTASLTHSLPPIIQRQCPVSHLPSQAASDSVACPAAVASPHAMGQLVNWRHVHPLGHGSGVSLQGLPHRLANVSLPIKCNLPTVRRLTHTPQLNVQGGNPTRNP